MKHIYVTTIIIASFMCVGMATASEKQLNIKNGLRLGITVNKAVSILGNKYEKEDEVVPSFR